MSYSVPRPFSGNSLGGEVTGVVLKSTAAAAGITVCPACRDRKQGGVPVPEVGTMGSTMGKATRKDGWPPRTCCTLEGWRQKNF